MSTVTCTYLGLLNQTTSRQILSGETVSLFKRNYYNSNKLLHSCFFKVIHGFPYFLIGIASPKHSVAEPDRSFQFVADCDRTVGTIFSTDVKKFFFSFIHPKRKTIISGNRYRYLNLVKFYV